MFVSRYLHFSFLLAAVQFNIGGITAFVRIRDHHEGRILLKRSLFFKQTFEEIEKQKKRRRKRWEVPDQNVVELINGPVEFPYRIELQYNGNSGTFLPLGGNRQTEKQQKKKTLTIRHLEKDDIPRMMPMCIREFVVGGKAPTLTDFPLDNLASWKEWLEGFTFGPLVSSAVNMKVQRRIDGDDPKNAAGPDDNILCLTFGEDKDNIIGIVELSLQPPEAERNPPPYPISMGLKEAYCKSKGLEAPVAWVSNVLIDENYRGLGFSKILMWAVEGLAKSWGYSSIYLHAPADSVGGKAPQALYTSLGYRPVIQKAKNSLYEWMGPDMLKTGVYLVEGVPLLFLRKDLNDVTSPKAAELQPYFPR